MAATFGDFLRAGRAGLDAAETASLSQPSVQVAAAAGQLHRLITTMTRCAGDLVPGHGVSTAASRSDLDPWTLAVIDTRDAFRLAAAELRPPGPGAAGDAGLADPTARRLAGAASSLAAGRDLLQTHFSTDPGSAPVQRSDWSAVITSAEVSAALADELVSWARRLAPVAARLSAAGQDAAVPAATRAGLRAAAEWLSTAGKLTGPAQQAHTASAPARRLLRAIPAYSVPPRRPPADPARAGDPEPVAGLCGGIAVSAERLRVLARRRAADARWSPAAAAAAWRSTASAAAAAGHASEVVLRSLADRARDVDPSHVAQLRAAADAVAQAWPAWRRVVTAWGKMTTESSSRVSLTVIETSDLLLRMGRLAWRDPHWTPGPGQSSPQRDPAALAPDRRGAAAVLAAVHHAWDALAKVASADRQAAAAAGGAQRLYLPAASLGRKIRYQYGGAPAGRVDALLDAYWTAARTSGQAVAALDAAAVACRAPSSLLAAARQAGSRQRAPGPWREPSGRPPEHGLEIKPSRHAGPIEAAVRRLGLADPAMALRAAVIDQAGQDLIAEASAAAKLSGAPATGGPARQPAPSSDAAQLAAQGFPTGPVTRQPAGQDPPAHASARPAPPPRAPRPRRGRG